MTPLELTLENFGPFKSRQRFSFPRSNGFYFMWGENQAEPRLGRNGAGKSKLWEALLWVIYGKTSRGLKAGDIANWDAGKGTVVTFSYSSELHGPCIVKRTWSPNSWTWSDLFGHKHDLAKDETNPLLEELRLNFNAFLQCTMMAQKVPWFLDLPAPAKAELFSNVLNLDRWLGYSKRAADKADEQDRTCRLLERELAEVNGKLKELADTTLQQQQAEWEADKKRRLASIEREYDQLLVDEAKAEKRLQGLAEAENAARAVFKDQQAELGHLTEATEDAKAAERSAADAARDAKRDLNDAGDDVAHAQASHCNHCRQDITPAQQRRNLAIAERALDEAAHGFNTANKALSKAEKATKDCIRQEAAASAALEKARSALHAATDAVKDARRRYQDIAASLDQLEEQHERLVADAGPFQALLAQQGARVDLLRGERRDLSARLDQAESRLSLMRHWVRGFKEIRLSLIAEAMEELEIEVNSSLNELGLVDWELQFEMDRETKGGSLQRGFSAYVRSPYNSKRVPWEAWSGGESQRLLIGTQQGMANLIRSRTGTPLNLEVWDEPTQWISPEGITDLLDSLSQRSKTEGRQIWIIDHRSFDYGNFDGQYGIIKTKDGSYIEG